VLDDATPLQRLAAARTQPVTLFPIRTATLWASFPSVEPGDGNAMPSNAFTGPNAPSGAVISFFQKAKAKVRPWIEIVDAQGKVVRTLRGGIPFNPENPPKTEAGKFYVTNDIGVNRVTWDGNENGPTRWLGANFENQGPTAGPEALPGTYTARLHIDNQTLEQQFALVDDPLSPWTPEQRQARHSYLVTGFGWLDRVDRALNAIDAKTKTASPAERAKLTALRNELTSPPGRDEDSIKYPDRIRQQIFGAIYAIGGSLQTPFAQHNAALEALRPQVQRALSDAASMLGTQ
jgi:hypothetical protein